MKEEWLFPNAVVPVDAQTTAALVDEIKRLIGVVGDMALKVADEREACAAKAEQVGQYKNHIGIAAAIRARGSA
jgi:hypothetical protein